MAMPERIWVEAPYGCYDDEDAGVWQRKKWPLATTSYIRADLYDELAEALRVYATKDNWQMIRTPGVPARGQFLVDTNPMFIARAALAKVKT